MSTNGLEPREPYGQTSNRQSNPGRDQDDLQTILDGYRQLSLSATVCKWVVDESQTGHS